MSTPSGEAAGAAGSDAKPSPSSQAREEDRVLYRDVEEFERKRQRIAAGGAGRLQIISGTGGRAGQGALQHLRAHVCTT